MSMATNTSPLKTVLVVGGSYVGQMVAQELMKEGVLPEGHRVVVVEQNSHFGHLFAYPRFASLPPSAPQADHTHKAFLPFAHPSGPMLPFPHGVVQAKVLELGEGRAVLDREVRLPGEMDGAREVRYEAAVVATGTTLSRPGTLDPEKADSVAYLHSVQRKLQKAENIVIVGGGAVGVQMASDLSVLYADSPQPKRITLIQSRRLMPRFHPALHELVMKRLTELGVEVVTGVRAKLPGGEGGYEELNERGGSEVELNDGRRLTANYVIHALGQTPNTALIRSTAPSAINPQNGFLRVTPSLLVEPAEEKERETLRGRVWAVGDVADSGAPKAARPAMQQAQIVAHNLARMVKGEEGEEKTYHPTPAAIHLTLGIAESVIFRNPPSSLSATGEVAWEGEPEIVWKDDGVEDMGIEGVWDRRLPGFVNGDASRYHL
ncbi:hypothetical protein JCM10213_001598 [Rhodosporidiobolus nylandii]